MKEDDQWSEVGVLTKKRIIPDHQLENFEALSDDSLRLFRISLVVLSVYGSVFGFIFNSGSEAIVNVLTHPAVALSMIFFLVALGGFMIAYRFARLYSTNAIKATDYIELHDDVTSDPEQEIEKRDLIYEHYWKGTLDYNSPTRDIQRIIYISGYSLYTAVIYGPMGFLSFYITFPPWLISVVIGGPMIVPLIFAKLAGIFGVSGGIVVKPEENLEKEPEETG